MKDMVLAAGKGTRVQPLTFSVPMPMIPMARKPVLESIIELLRQHGFDQIVINTSHLAPTIEDYFRDGSAWGMEIAYSFEGHIEEGEIKAEALGSAGGMKRIQDFSGFFDATFLVLCGDALIDDARHLQQLRDEHNLLVELARKSGLVQGTDP
jgi:mannose-1-phosphate guanylyltransferase